MAWNGVFAGWEEFAVLAALVSVFASTLLLMFSRAFQFAQWQQLAKLEIIYAASTVFLVVVITALLSFGQNPLVAMASQMYAASYGISVPGILVNDAGQQATLIDIAKLYMQPPVECSKTIINQLYRISIFAEPIASVYMEIFMSEHASGFGFKVLTERINNAVQFLQFYVFAYYVMVHILNFINHYALFFLGVGVVLRAFPPTRGAGAYIIGLSLGFYIIFPMVYILSSSVVMPYIKSGTISGGSTPQYEAGRGFSSNIVCTVPAIGDFNYAGFTSVGKIFEIKSWFDVHKGTIRSFFDANLTSFFRHIVIALCFLPLVSMVLVLTFVLSTTNLFGGNIPEIGRGLVKLL